MRRKHPIETLIEQGEHQQLDFKFEVSDSKKIARTLSAFANTDGGRLLIGVKDNGHISGIRSEEEYYMIEAASKLYTRPEVPFEATRWEINGKTVLEIYVAPCPDRPYMAPDKDDRFKAYIRVADENILASVVRLAVWRQERSSVGATVHFSGAEKKMLDMLGTGEPLSLNACVRAAGVSRSAGANILARFIRFGLAEEVLEGHKFFYRCRQVLPDGAVD